MPWLTLSGSNYPCLERIYMVPKMFEPLRFDCIFFMQTTNSGHAVRMCKLIWVFVRRSCQNVRFSNEAMCRKKKHCVIWGYRTSLASHVFALTGLSTSYHELTLSALQTKANTFASNTNQNETARRLIWIYTFCHSVFDVWMISQFATMGISKFRDRRFYFRNAGAKGLTKT